MSSKRKVGKAATQAKKRRSGSSSASYREAALKRATEAIVGQPVHGVEYPGGRSRESYLMRLADGKSVVATRRDKLERARLEVNILSALGRHAVPVPRLLGTNHSHILIQEALCGERLSLALQHADEPETHRLLGSALDSLLGIQKAATAEHLESQVGALGSGADWIAGLLRRPAVIGKYLGVPAPTLDVDALVKTLGAADPRFIKWDTRPGNAMVLVDGSVAWFDWEHAGKRNRLDDVAWILGDEFVPDYPQMEADLIDHYVPAFGDPLDATAATHYLMAYGSFHMVVRLGLILKYMDGEWWDLDHCISNDKVGVTLACARRLCRRGARWSARHPLTAALSPWFEQIEPAIAAL